MSTSRLTPIFALGLLLLPACGSSDSTPSGRSMPYGGAYNYGSYGNGDPANEQFKDDVQTNNTPKKPLQELSFVNLKGEEVPLKSYLGVKNLVLVVTRGQVGGTLCPYCSTQTSRLISNYKEITKRDAEVIVVFPVEWNSKAPQYDSFRQAAKEKIKTDPSAAPFPMLLDLELNAVKSLDIQKNLAKPATYILDKKGQVRFAYVGETLIDRPSMKAILKQLDELQDAKKS
jgi:peroxiredoxin